MEPQTQITNLVPIGWFKNKQSSSIWITAYRIVMADREQLKGGRVHDFDKVRIIALFGKLQYLDTSHTRIEIDNAGNISVDPKIEAGVTPEDGWLLIIQPYVIDGIERKEYEVRIRAGIFAGLYAAINGRNMAFERVFDNVAAMLDGRPTASSPTFLNPHAFIRPDLSKEKLDSIQKAGKLLEAKTQNERKRIELSLHWFEKGLRSMGLDGFINYWVALETLGMPDTTNIKPLIESLARTYKISTQEATNKFGVGKIFGLRSRILHNGEDLPIHQMLSAYIENMFVDVLLDHIGMPSEMKAQNILDNPDFNLDKLVHTAA